jgi:thiol-disulfide isomerase/thioredoxin
MNAFYMRPDEELSEQDLAKRDQLPDILVNAIHLLQLSHAAAFDGSFQLFEQRVQVAKQTSIKEPGLRVFGGSRKQPELKLTSLQKHNFDLSDYRGQVVLVNFWATWCGPCVEEMPSLSRLAEKMKGQPFKVVGVNIGESAQAINEFLRKIPANFEILLDRNGQAVRDWKVYAYPSNYVVDKQGVIRYAYRGALQWDSAAIIQTIKTLF